jgi:peptide/nickel transport system substrate-binding protein
MPTDSNERGEGSTGSVPVDEVIRPHSDRQPTGSDRAPTARTDDRELTRRNHLRLLGMLGLAGGAGVAGCMGGGGGDGTPTPGTDTGTSDPSPTSTEGSDGETDSPTDTTTQMEALPSVGGRESLGLAADAKTMIPWRHSDTTTSTYISATMDSAYGWKDVGEPFHMWIESYSDVDKTEWTYKLRENLRWSDPYGQQTAEDWVYFVQNVHQSDWSGSVTGGQWMYTDDSGNQQPYDVEKLGKYEFKVTLNQPVSGFPTQAMWGARCVPKGLIKTYVDNQDAEGIKKDETINRLQYTGNLGPYNFEQWERESRFFATRNDDYYLREVDDMPRRFEGAPYFEEFEIQVIPEQSARLAALRDGQLTQHEDVAADKVASLRQEDDLKFRYPPNPYCPMAWYNMRANGWPEGLRNVPVRQGLSMGVSKQQIADDIYSGFPTPAHTFQPEWSPFFDDSKVMRTGVGDTYGYDMARQKIREGLSGTDWGFDGGRLKNPQGQNAQLKIVYVAGSPLTQQLAEFFQQELDEVGIATTLENGGPGNTVQNKYMQQRGAEGTLSFNAGDRDQFTSEKSWDILIGFGGNSYPINPTNGEVFFAQNGGFNFMGYHPEADVRGLYNRAKRATSDQERKAAFAELFGALSEEQPNNFLHFDVYKNAYQTDYVGMPAQGEYGYLDGWDGVTWYTES